MGNWNINIQGTGPHHNGKPQDADFIANELVAMLRGMGHTITSAGFMPIGERDNIMELSKPLVGPVMAKVNGQSHEFDGGIVKYEDVVGAAYRASTPEDKTRMLANRPTITFSRARFGKEGILSPGEQIEILPGAVFSVAHTGAA